MHGFKMIKPRGTIVLFGSASEKVKPFPLTKLARQITVSQKGDS